MRAQPPHRRAAFQSSAQCFLPDSAFSERVEPFRRTRAEFVKRRATICSAQAPDFLSGESEGSTRSEPDSVSQTRRSSLGTYPQALSPSLLVRIAFPPCPLDMFRARSGSPRHTSSAIHLQQCCISSLLSAGRPELKFARSAVAKVVCAT
eukprot:6209826-Pleurochrysis_carterae.AAC.2